MEKTMKPTSKQFTCPYCGRRFWHSLAVSDEPDLCPLCNNSGEAIEVSDALPDDFTGPHIASGRGKATDDYIKAMEEGEKFRTDLAVEKFDMTREEAKTLEETPGMRDGLKAGETGIRPIENTVSQQMAAMPNLREAVLGNPTIRSGAATGPNAFAGMKALAGLRQQHGNLGHVVTDVPAVECGMRDQLMAAAGFRR
jgi:hypothetical protein